MADGANDLQWFTRLGSLYVTAIIKWNNNNVILFEIIII